MKTLFKKAALSFCLLAGTSMALAASDPHAGHHAAKPVVTKSSEVQAPMLKLLMPRNGDRVAGQMAIVIETDADLGETTMSAAKIGTHLHIRLDDNSMMPMREQFFSVGGNRYVYLFDLPVTPGKHQVSVYWAGGDHQTIEASIQRADITVQDH